MNFESKKRSYIVSKTHYDVGNKLYIRMLDFYMTYRSAYYQKEQSEYAKEHYKD
ncbi:class I SAM-dependent methyltransferase [Coxiella-like endosymbiont]|uniref:class I SAM-dependent methyltransferase n=1 Tax=Coxiella-like endosymbiont TaxID=1592897 RepID=UPI0034E1F8AE